MVNAIDRYFARPDNEVFNSMTLAEFASEFRVIESSYKGMADVDDTPEESCLATTNSKNKTQENKSDDNVQENSAKSKSNKTYQFANGLGTVKRRQNPSIIRYTRFNRDKNAELYYCSLIKMYFLHREDIVPNPTYEAFFQQHSEVILTNMSKYEKLTHELDEAWQMLQEGDISEETWAQIAPNQEVERAEQTEELEFMQQFQNDSEEIEIDNLPNLLPDSSTSNINVVQSVSTKVTSLKDHQNRLRLLNSKQSQLLYFIRNWALQKRHGQDVKPFTIFLIGCAGTGKSHLIKCIHYEFDKILTVHKENPDSPLVLLVAYTGTAAYNIGGPTIHSALGINKSMGKSLVEEQANTLRCKLQNLQLLIIDEVSMVSTPMLNLIHSRLQQIKQPSSQSAVFGNINILAVGDFYQVPSVAAKPLTSNYTSLTDLWSKFAFGN